jgi:hypothetical protein
MNRISFFMILKKLFMLKFILHYIYWKKMKKQETLSQKIDT